MTEPNGVPLQNDRGFNASAAGSASISASIDRLNRDELFRVLVANIPGVVYLCGTEHRPTMFYLSDSIQELTGYPAEEFLSDRVSLVDLMSPEDAARIILETQAAIEKKQRFTITYAFRHADGRVMWAEGHGQGIFDTAGNLSAVEGTILDVTQRVLSERALRASEHRFKRLSESNILGVVFWDLNGGITDANDAFLEIVGASREDLAQGRLRWDIMTPPEYRESDLRAVANLKATGANPGYEKEFFRLDGTRVPILIGGAMFDESPGQGVSFVLDISRRKIAEDALRHAHDELELRVQQRTAELEGAVRELKVEERILRMTLDAHEKERQLLAYELHDGLIQDLVGAKLLLEALSARLPGDASVMEEKLASIQSVLLRSIGEGRRMISDLRPLVIDEAGIVEAIKYLVEKQRARFGLHIRFEHSVQFTRLAPLLEGSLYRIVQESLTNVQRHSQASDVKIRLSQPDGFILLQVDDDGVGFEPAAVPEDRLGLEGIRKRASLFGGAAKIISAPGQGTHIRVEIPLNESTAG